MSARFLVTPQSVRALLALFPLATVASVACQSPTQAIVAIYTDMPCAPIDQETLRDALTDYHIYAAPTRDALATKLAAGQFDATATCTPGDKGRLLGTLVLAPGESEVHVAIRGGIWALGQATVAAEACANNPGQCITARRILRYEKHQTLNLPIPLDAACARVQCGADQTCVKGACMSIAQVSGVDPPQPPDAGSSGTPEAGSPESGPGTDAGAAASFLSCIGTGGTAQITGAPAKGCNGAKVGNVVCAESTQTGYGLCVGTAACEKLPAETACCALNAAGSPCCLVPNQAGGPPIPVVGQPPNATGCTDDPILRIGKLCFATAECKGALECIMFEDANEQSLGYGQCGFRPMPQTDGGR